MIKSYKKFSSIRPLNEDVQMAKSFLQKRFLANKREEFVKKGGDPEEAKLVKLTPEEIKKAESDKNYIEIRDFLLKDNAAGCVGPFVRFFFDGLDMKGIINLYQRYKSLKQFHNRLGLEGSEWPYTNLNGKPKILIDYIIKKDINEKRPSSEILSDDLVKLEICRTTKRWTDNLPKEFVISTNPNNPNNGKTIPSILDECKNTTSPIIKKKIMGIAQAFEDFGKDTSGKMDIEKNRQIYLEFFGRIVDVPISDKYPKGRKYIGNAKTWKSLNDVIIKANKSLSANNKSDKLDYYNQLERVNLKYGVMNGAVVVFDDEDILIVQIFSFQANSELNSKARHCICNDIFSWDRYVGKDELYTNQYYLYNWNLPPSDHKSIIGITIDENSRVTDCCDKNNIIFNMPNYIEQLRSEFSELKNSLSMEVFAPMTPEQVEQKKKRVAANKEIILPNITIEKIITCIENGADPNARGKHNDSDVVSKPLMNAVVENDYKKAVFLINKGAKVTLCPCLKESKDFEMLKLLIRSGAEMDRKVYETYAHDYKAVRYLLDFGLDKNYKEGYPIRTSIDKGNKEVIDLLFSREVDFSQRNYIAIEKSLKNPSLLEHLMNLLVTKKFTMPEDCKTCDGATELYKNKGDIDEERNDCPHCNGTGKEPGGKMVEKSIKVTEDYKLETFIEHIERINVIKYPNPQDKPKLLKMMMDYGMSHYNEKDVKDFFESERNDMENYNLVKPILQKLKNFEEYLTEKEKETNKN